VVFASVNCKYAGDADDTTAAVPSIVQPPAVGLGTLVAPLELTPVPLSETTCALSPSFTVIEYDPDAAPGAVGLKVTDSVRASPGVMTVPTVSGLGALNGVAGAVTAVTFSAVAPVLLTIKVDVEVDPSVTLPNGTVVLDSDSTPGPLEVPPVVIVTFSTACRSVSPPSPPVKAR
jgi:hypothetical protein